MGIGMCQVDSQFFIPKCNIKPLYDAMVKESNILPEDRVENPDVEDLNDIMPNCGEGLWDFCLEDDAQGNVINIFFEGENYHADDHPQCLEIFIPYVQEGSYLCMLLEINIHEKWLFKNGKILVCDGHVVYDETEPVSEEK